MERSEKIRAMPADSGRESARSRQSHAYDDFIRQIIESDAFRTAPAMRALLGWLWAHAGQSLSEYAIGTEALGRGPDFDPRTDSTVRVQIARLRAKLKEFYETAGADFPLRITLPLGSHELQWSYHPGPSAARSAFDGIPRRYLLTAGLTGSVLIAVCAGLLLEVHALKSRIPAPSPLPRFWQSFLSPGKPTVIVVPNPVCFAWPAHEIYVRDFEVSDYADWTKSPFLNGIAQKWGPPELSQQYVGVMEMTASTRLMKYLEQHGQPVELIESRRFPLESFAAQNTIFLGMPRTAGYLNQMLAKTNFYLSGINADVVRNRHPQQREPAEFSTVNYASDRRLAPAIVTLLPARPEHTRMLLLLGLNLTSITSLLLNPDGLNLLDAEWRKAGSPDAWEMVLQADVYRDTVLKVSPVAIRAIAPDFWQRSQNQAP